ncbi:MAG: DUF6807 family protein [Planctomycetota bacterium]
MHFFDRQILQPLCLLSACFLGSNLHAQEQAAFAALQDDNAITIVEGVRPVLTYQKGTRTMDGKWPRSHYVHPLYDLEGNSLTEDFPIDHGHHRGVFWTWHQVQVDGKPMGDAWLCKDFTWNVRRVEVSRQLRSATLNTEVEWTSPEYTDHNGKQIAFVRENAKILIHAAEPNFRCIDFDLRFLALTDDIQIGGSEDAKGYGGFSPRIRLEKDFQFTSDTGIIEPTTNAIKAGPWINIANQRVGFAMMSYPKNPAPRHQWILRAQGSMQNAAFPGRERISLSTESPLRLRYRIVLHRGNLSSESLAQLYQEYATSE